MAFLIHPRGGIPPLPAPPADHAQYLAQLIDWRSQQLDAFWEQLTTQLQLSADERARAQRSMQKLVGIGMLAIEEDIAPVDRLRQLTAVELFIDQPLPTPVQTISGSGASTPRLWHLDNIHVKPGFDGTGVTVGVIDSGYDPAFPDLQGSFAPLFAQYTPAPSGSTALGTMVIKTTASDLSPDQHGSKVCVMLAGKTAGAAPQARVLVASLGAQGFSATKHQMALAIDWLLIQPTGAHPDRPYGCDIISTSLHSAGPGVANAGSAIEIALAAAETFNTLVVAAIGNGGAGKWQPPGSEPNVIGVGAVDDHGQVLISAYGPITPSGYKPDLVAPGDNVQIPDGAGGTTFLSGSSFAAPIAAGAVAIILQQHPHLRPAVGKLRSTFLTFTSPPTTQSLTASGHGIVDLNGL